MNFTWVKRKDCKVLLQDLTLVTFMYEKIMLLKLDNISILHCHYKYIISTLNIGIMFTKNAFFMELTII